ncbi:MAG: hypothetical protein ACOZB0_09060 [Pseudomonadota bacterium]
MKHQLVSRNLLASLGLATLLASGGCTQMPTEKQGAVDLRPQIAFQVSDERLHEATVKVDGRAVGRLGDYLNDKAALRLLTGMHLIQVEQAGRLLLEERLYLGDGASRSLQVH